MSFTQSLLNNKNTQKLIKTQDIFLKSYHRKKSFFQFLDSIYQNDISKYDIYKVFGDFKKYKINKSIFLDCGSWLVFNYFYNKEELRLDKANFCKKDKLCQACAVRRAYKQQNKFLDILYSNHQLLSNNWYYIVIPVKHSKEESLIEVFNKIIKIRKSISQSIRDAKKGRKSGIWGNFKGGMGSIEITKTHNGWNVHLNYLLNASNGSNLRLKVVRNRNGQLSYQNDEIRLFLMRIANSQMHNISKLDFSTDESIKTNLVEVLKYSLKFSSLNNEDLLEVCLKLHRRQLFFTFGNLRGVEVEDKELEGEEFIDNEFIQLIYQRVNDKYNFYKSDYSRVVKSS